MGFVGRKMRNKKGLFAVTMSGSTLRQDIYLRRILEDDISSHQFTENTPGI